jgi:hypothetical protein
MLGPISGTVEVKPFVEVPPCQILVYRRGRLEVRIHVGCCLITDEGGQGGYVAPYIETARFDFF